MERAAFIRFFIFPFRVCSNLALTYRSLVILLYVAFDVEEEGGFSDREVRLLQVITGYYRQEGNLVCHECTKSDFHQFAEVEINTTVAYLFQ